MSKLINENKDRVVKIKEALKGLSFSDGSKLLYEIGEELGFELII